jgi:hypothetical protein
MIFVLAVFTLLSGIAGGIWQLRRVKKAKIRGERSELEYAQSRRR